MAKEQHQHYIVKKLENSINFDLEPSRIVAALNEAIKFSRMKGVVGRGFDVVAYTKWVLEELIQEWS